MTGKNWWHFSEKLMYLIWIVVSHFQCRRSIHDHRYFCPMWKKCSKRSKFISVKLTGNSLSPSVARSMPKCLKSALQLRRCSRSFWFFCLTYLTLNNYMITLFVHYQRSLCLSFGVRVCLSELLFISFN